MKLFQIEEPDGGPADPEAPGAAVGIDAAGVRVEVACSVGGNALVLQDREGFEGALPVPPLEADFASWQNLFEGARICAERALARPVTHAVIVLAATPDAGASERLLQAADRAGLAVLRLLRADELSGSNPALAAAVLAEDLAPRPELGDRRGRS
ncbi:MAG: hypothetical protein JO139_05850 [Alphaproteobacteria bacterium]|nr:hypothetical protein [Alphaproteobacteria bacterium]